MTTATATATATTPNVAPVSETNGFSISSLVLGIVSIFASFTFFVPVIGLVLGIMALRREPASRTMAVWGIVLNAVMLAGTVIATLAALAFGLVLLPFAFI
ncbi:hypothetical protein BJ978_002179 [Agromyces terreus]|uniref:DUF4190 domain-containing protein n=1 Tax=Agromyces terreus TaxID=424795 RepID=A0A9X2H1Y9_9MICO|nr:DUF4190 domain-containing protein [Agromyces terreus]MCP2371503.1 hypothetical protein [Agromyces terreus]